MQTGCDCGSTTDALRNGVRPAVHEVQTKNLISRSALADYAVNPYGGCTHACMYCYAAAMRRRKAHAEPWGEYVDVKSWPPIRNPGRYRGKRIVVGSVTDPYQPHEATYKRTRLFLEQMRDSGAWIEIITKSDLILRDLDLICSIPDAHVTFSINTLDETARADMDRAAPIVRRLDAMRQFHEAGVPTTCFAAPVMPGITGVPSIILAVRDSCDTVLIDSLNIRSHDNLHTVMTYIRDKHPKLEELYKKIYIGGMRQYWDALDRQLRKFALDAGMSYVRNGHEDAVMGSKPNIVLFA